jgi:multicomponent Na+:H+ antiporter subunit G
LIRLIGEILIVIGIVFIVFAYFGIFRFRDFYSRILVSSKADAVGLITILTGVMLIKGISFFSLKVLMILIFAILINPNTNHSIARSAYLSGYKVQKERENE